jgi:hypothetical protein
MKIQPRHFIAAPFLALAAMLAFEVAQSLGASVQKGWDHLVMTLVFGSIMIGVVAVPGYLALKRRWEEFVKIVGVVVAIALFSLVANTTQGLEKVVDNLVGQTYPLLGALWGLTVVASQLVIPVVAYRRFVPLIIRRIYRTPKSPCSSTPL